MQYYHPMPIVKGLKQEFLVFASEWNKKIKVKKLLSWHNNLFVWLSFLLQWAHTHFLRFLVVLLLFLIGLRVNAVCFGLACATWPHHGHCGEIDHFTAAPIYYFTIFFQKMSEALTRFFNFQSGWSFWYCKLAMHEAIRSHYYFVQSRLKTMGSSSWLLCCLMHLWKCSLREFTDLTFHFQKWFKDH